MIKDKRFELPLQQWIRISNAQISRSKRRTTTRWHARLRAGYGLSARSIYTADVLLAPSNEGNKPPTPMIDLEDKSLPIPIYKEKKNEPLQLQKSRLLYQSRKRGMLENGLLLSTFAAKHLDSMDAKQTKLYDQLINMPTNDWDIFYWATGVKPTPAEYDNEIMAMLKEHVKNANREKRICQPNLY